MILIVAIFFGLISVFLVAIFWIGHALSVPSYAGPETSHFDGRKFRNPSGRKAKGFRDVFKFMRETDRGEWVFRNDAYVREESLPTPGEDLVQVTFINHSTFLIQIGALNILTDPIWSDRCSPVSWAGPTRLRPPGIRFEDLPPIDLVLLTHNHYDHLDLPTIRKLENEHDPEYIVPLGVRSFLKRQRIRNIRELDWWQETEKASLQVQATPANHFSGRGLFDRDRTLWCGYLLSTNRFTIYYAGDTGYSNLFKEIGERAGNIDLAFIPIGAFEPRWFMSPIHASPEEAVQIHHDIGATTSMAMHFGCFPLATEGSGRAEEALIKARRDNGIQPGDFIIPQEGKPLRFAAKK